MKKHLLSSWFALILIACVAFGVYSNSLRVPFAFDDIHTIKNSINIRDLSNFFSQAKFLSKRSVANFTFSLNYFFGGANVFGYHLVNILIHIINGFVVYFLSLEILKLICRPSGAGMEVESSKLKAKTGKVKRKNVRDRVLKKDVILNQNSQLPIIALFAALIFVAHPIQTQAVTYIVQRYTSMAAMFYLGSVLFYMKARIIAQSSKVKAQSIVSQPLSAFGFQLSALYALSILCGILAFLSKQTAASLPLAIVLVEAICFRGTRKQWGKRILWMIPACGLFAAFIFYAMGIFGGGIGDMLEDISRLSRETELVSRWDYLCTQFSVLVIYLRLMVFPVGQNLDYYYPFKTGFFEGFTPLAFIFLTGLAILAIWKRREFPLFTFAVFWFFVTLSVESSIIPISDALFEHRMYLPLFGFALCAAWFPFRFLQKRRAIAVCICASIIVTLGMATYLRNRVWQDDLTLWTDVLSKAPWNPRAALNLGNALGSRGRYDEAMRVYTHILRSNPDSAKVHHNIGVVHEKKGEIQKAISAYREALRINPRYAPSRVSLANIFKKQNNPEEALSHYREVLRTDPRNADAHNRIGIAFLQMGDMDRAFVHLNKSVLLDPNNDEALNNIGGILETRGDLEGAAGRYTEALVINPGNPEARTNLSRVLVNAGDRALASRCYGLVLKSAHGHAELHMDFGIVLSRLGYLEDAIRQFREVVRIAPEDGSARYNLGLAYSRQGKLGDAAREFQASLEIAPGNHKARYNLALALYAAGDYTGAITCFEEVVLREPALEARASYDIARAYARDGRVKESVQWLQRAVDAGFNDWDRIKTDSDLNNILGTKQYKTIMEGR